MAEMQRIVFLGSDAIALPLLEWVAARSEATLVAVYTQPDRPVGRGQKVQANAIKTWATARGIPVLQPERLGPEQLGELAALRADLGLVMAYGHILSDAFIAAPRLGMVNFHASVLPALRGASPIQTAVATGLSETGVSLMRIVRELDAGPVADVEKVCIRNRDTATDVEAGLSAGCAPLLARNWDALLGGTLIFAEQDRSRATFCRKLTKEDAVLDFSLPASALAARINGLYPWPATNVLLGGQSVKLGLAEPVAGVSTDKASGTVLGADAEGLLVASGLGVLRLLRLQRPGGKMLPAPEFLRGCSVEPGVVIRSQTQPPLEDTKPFRKTACPGT